MWVNLDLFWSLLVYLGLSLFLLVSISLSWSLLVNLIFAALKVVCFSLAFLGVSLSYDGRFVYFGFAFTVLNRKMLQLLYQRIPMRTEQVSEKPDEILEENFFYELTSQPTGLVILLMLRRED